MAHMGWGALQDHFPDTRGESRGGGVDLENDGVEECKEEVQKCEGVCVWWSGSRKSRLDETCRGREEVNWCVGGTRYLAGATWVLASRVTAEVPYQSTGDAVATLHVPGTDLPQLGATGVL